ncbi:MAG TPA: hypothetical protein VMF51_22415 [Nocardioides sp.]|uniref:hypothetical protein n=1 Tax=Nocardioides sp. TaxID=35761 RepID=UPI002B927CDE|nr:hypothetical protein [Nocardioides sp.]HTW17898.1 hypothetical protein [Nocardioides sp.]
MNHVLRASGWRLALVTSGVLLALGGRMHPEADAADSATQELATMTADERWVPGHTLILASTVLLAAGLWLVLRGRVWPRRVDGTLRIAAVTISLYVVETVFHLAASVDSDELAAGESAPIAWAHLGLSAFLYPASGLALAYLGASLFAAWRGPRRLLALPGIVAGTAHALSVPATILLPDAELSPVFAGAALTLALWSVLLGLASAPYRRPVVAVPAPEAASQH